MRPKEAKYVGQLVSGLGPAEISTVVNLGSSTKYFREVDQPHIHHQIFGPLEHEGVHVIHVDLLRDQGVDVVGDIFDPNIQEEIKCHRPQLILCCNMFEHVSDPVALAQICSDLVIPGGYVLVTVPNSYPYHPDPIDTYFRPSPEQIIDLFDGFVALEACIVEDMTFWQPLRWQKSNIVLLLFFALNLILFFVPLPNMRTWKKRWHRFLWLNRPFKVSVSLLRKSIT